MAKSQFSYSFISGIVSAIPQNVEDNLEIPFIDLVERQALVKHTGIRYRRCAPKNETIVHYFTTVTKRLLEAKDWTSKEVDILICITQSPDYSIPAIANRLHGDLNFSNQTFCFDITSGCSGFVYGLHTIYALLASLGKKHAKAILCCGDFSTHLIDPLDKSVVPIFSDGVAAIAVEYDENRAIPTSFFNSETDGSGQHAIEMKKQDDDDACFMRLNGIDVFGYSVKHVPTNIRELLMFANVSTNEVDYLVMHQANQLINGNIARSIGIADEQVPSNLYDFGNTASASIPLTIATKINGDSERLLIAGFGVGFSYASALISYFPTFEASVIEI